MASTAPVKLPFSCPKSSLSMSPSGMAPQLMATKGWSLRSLRAWMLRATTSLPVPLSPVTSTVVLVGASFSTSCRTSRMGGESPRISSGPPRRAPTWWRSSRFSATSAPCSSAFSRTSRSSSTLKGFST